MTTPKRYRLLQSIYSPVGNEKCGTIKTDFEWTNQFPSLLGVGFSNLTEWFEPIPDEQTTKEGWSDEDMILFADRHSQHYIGEKELQKFKASKQKKKLQSESIPEFHESIKNMSQESKDRVDGFLQSQLKEERCIIENKDLRIFTDKKEEVKKDWEIIALIGKSSGNVYKYSSLTKCWIDKNSNGFAFNGTEEDLENSGCYIHSVRRLSDNEVFTVGDEMDGLGAKQNERHPITRIYPINGTIALGYGEDGARAIQSAIKAKNQPPPSNTERVECYFLSDIRKFSDGSVDYMIHVSSGISQEKFPLIKKAIEATLNGERQYTQKEMEEVRKEAFFSARRFAGQGEIENNLYECFSSGTQISVNRFKYKSIQDYLTTKNK